MLKKHLHTLTVFIGITSCIAIGSILVFVFLAGVPILALSGFAFRDTIDDRPESKYVDFLVTPQSLRTVATQRSRLYQQPNNLLGSILWYRRDGDYDYSKLNGHLVFADCTFPPTIPSSKMTTEQRQRRFLNVNKFLESKFLEQHRPLMRRAIEQGSGRVIEINLVPQEGTFHGIEFYVRYSNSVCVRYFEPTEPVGPLDIVSKIGLPIQDFPGWGQYHSNKFAGFRLGIVQPNGLKAPHSIF